MKVSSVSKQDFNGRKLIKEKDYDLKINWYWEYSVINSDNPAIWINRAKKSLMIMGIK